MPQIRAAQLANQSKIKPKAEIPLALKVCSLCTMARFREFTLTHEGDYKLEKLYIGFHSVTHP